MKINVIIPCGGSGARANLGYNKLKYNIGAMSLLAKTLSCWGREDVTKIIVAVSATDTDWVKNEISGTQQNIVLVEGGDTRSKSVFNALNVVDDDCDFVAIHDGARPFLSQKVIEDAICCCQKNGNACPCVSCVDSLRIVEENGNYPVDRQQYACVQTPQMFKPKELISAYKMAFEKGQTFSDDASVFQQFVGKVFLSQGDPANKKITTQDDFYAFAPNGFYVGVGWDTHQLVEGRKLILGGVQIEHTKGLLGHSDADVLTHAIMDAILSASHNRDIGCLFPDNDAAFKDIDSMILLAKVVKLVAEQGFEINNVSATIMAQKPKLATIIPTIADNLCNALSLRNNQLSIAATTTEKLGLVGHEEAISVYATCSLRQN